MKGKTVTLRPATRADSEFAYNVKKAALRSYVEQTWGWDEAFQSTYHTEHFQHSLIDIVQFGSKDIGWMGVTVAPEHVQINEMYILPQFQNQGIGTRLIKDIVAGAKARNVPVRLSVLKANPAKKLYERLGFVTVGESPTHYYMRTSVFKHRNKT